MNNIPKIIVEYENLGIIRINFDPVIKSWRFTRDNRNEMIADMYESITKQFVYRKLDSQLIFAIEAFTNQIVSSWIYAGDVLIPELSEPK